MKEYRQNYIDGTWADGGAGRAEIVDPGTGEVLAAQAMADGPDVNRAGQVFVNQWFAGGVETPFGGYGKSGYDREKGREALRLGS